MRVLSEGLGLPAAPAHDCQVERGLRVARLPNLPTQSWTSVKHVRSPKPRSGQMTLVCEPGSAWRVSGCPGLLAQTRPWGEADRVWISPPPRFLGWAPSRASR